MERSSLNAFSHVDEERAREAAASADVQLPFGGVPFGVKGSKQVAGWPYTEASLVFADRIGEHDATSVTRLRATGAVLVAQTTASEFGGINCTSTALHGTTRNPWDTTRTPGGSSGGSAAAVAGGLLPIAATGSDGGGSIRIPAGFAGLFGLKATYGRIPKGPRAGVEPLTSVMGRSTRSVRDTARYFDANGSDVRDPLSLPRVSGWEAGLGTHELRGKKVAIISDLGIAQSGPRWPTSWRAPAPSWPRLPGSRSSSSSPISPTCEASGRWQAKWPSWPTSGRRTPIASSSSARR